MVALFKIKIYISKQRREIQNIDMFLIHLNGIVVLCKREQAQFLMTSHCFNYFLFCVSCSSFKYLY